MPLSQPKAQTIFEVVAYRQSATAGEPIGDRCETHQTRGVIKSQSPARGIASFPGVAGTIFSIFGRRALDRFGFSAVQAFVQLVGERGCEYLAHALFRRIDPRATQSYVQFMADAKQVYNDGRYGVIEYQGADDDVVVLFPTWREDQSLAMPAFGETYLQRRGKSYLAVRAERNDWFQGPIELAIEAVRLRVAGRSAIGYGSSMGAYGAINFSEAIGLERSICFVPQYSIDAAKVPFERRWREEASQVRFHCDQIDKVLPHQCIVLYDPKHRPDTRHVNLIARTHKVRTIELPGAGHNVSRFLKDSGVITAATNALLEDSYESACRIIFNK